MDREDTIHYWIMSSDNDYRAMIHLFEKGDYTWSLFIGHLVIEKLLKAWYVRQVDTIPPFIHDLVRLSEKAGLSLSEDQKDILDTVSTFNLRSRYDDYRMSFYQKCSETFTEKWITEIKGFRQWLKDMLPKQQ
ncbi:MAG: HEPN domain-containing protein [Desulfatitalea sp.]